MWGARDEPGSALKLNCTTFQHLSNCCTNSSGKVDDNMPLKSSGVTLGHFSRIQATVPRTPWGWFSRKLLWKAADAAYLHTCSLWWLGNSWSLAFLAVLSLVRR